METIVELQQIEIHSLNEWKRGQTAGQVWCFVGTVGPQGVEHDRVLDFCNFMMHCIFFGFCLHYR